MTFQFDPVDLPRQFEQRFVASGFHRGEDIGYPLSDHRTVDLRAAEQRPPFARVGIYQDFHYKIIFSSERTRMSSAPIVLSCSILLHNSRSLITTWIELQPS